MFRMDNIIKPHKDKKLIKKAMENNPLFKKFNEKKDSKYIELKPKDSCNEKEVIY